MFFGRVDVYWPDRPVESYRLNKSTIAVGRSTGNDIVLDTTTISRYHITFTFKDQQVWLEDLESVNGTYVDSARLSAHTPVLLRGGEEIQIGEVRLIYHPPLAFDTASIDDTTQRVVLTQPSCRIELQGPDMPVAPGAHVQAMLKIENIGSVADRYLVEIDGLPKGWARADRVEVSLEPAELAQVAISIKPLRRSESHPGDRPFVVRVRSALRPTEILDARTVLHVLPFSGFGIALGDARVRDGEALTLYLHNQGNAPLPLTILGTDGARALQFNIPGAQVQLGPGERRTLIGTVSPRRPRWLGDERAHEFAILARAHDASNFLVAIPGTLLTKGRLPGWALVLLVPLVALVALGVLGIAALLVGGDEDPTPAVAPVITAFGPVEAPVAVGANATVAWSVAGAEEVTLDVQSARDERQIALDSGSETYALTFDKSGVYTLTLHARNGDAVAEATATIEVRPLVTLTVEVLGAAELVRSVQQEVRVRWSVVGAQEFDGGYRIWLESPTANRELLTAPMPLTGEQTLSVLVEDDVSEWLVTLYAQGEDQVLGAISQKLVVVHPICALETSQTVVRSGPGQDYPAILPPQPADPASGATLTYSPVARDASGQWLMVAISVDNRLGWVPRADFVCTNFDPERLRVNEQVPPVPDSGSGDLAGTATPAASPSAVRPAPTATSPITPPAVPSAAP